jgi:hypothetical protein
MVEFIRGLLYDASSWRKHLLVPCQNNETLLAQAFARALSE